jgi:hypothetical protein
VLIATVLIATVLIATVLIVTVLITVELCGSRSTLNLTESNTYGSDRTGKGCPNSITGMPSGKAGTADWTVGLIDELLNGALG